MHLRSIVSAMLLKGFSYEQTAELAADEYKEPVTVRMVADCRRRAYRQAKLDVRRNNADLVANELERLNAIEREAWQAWEASKQPAKLLRKTSRGDADTGATTQQIADQTGNPAFLNVVRQCVQDRRDLLGLDAPKRAELAVTAGDLSGLTDDDLRVIIDAEPGEPIPGDIVGQLAEPRLLECDEGDEGDEEPEGESDVRS